jgi:hypothetical protein
VVEQDLRDKAREVARATLETRWPRERFELELESEREERWNHLFDRSHYAAAFRVFELADTARVSLAPDGSIEGVRYPVDASEAQGEPAPEPTPDQLVRARAAAEEAARRGGRWQTLRSKVVAVLRESGARVDAVVRLFSLAPEGPLTVDLDASSGERLAFFVPCLLRGSRGGRPLSRREVVARVQEEEILPKDLELKRADLEEASGVRLWRLRFEASGLERSGQAIVCAHARTGVVAGLTSTLRARVRLGRSVARDRAHELLERALPVLLGPDSRLASIVPGAIVRRGKPRAGWVGTALTGEGDVARVALSGDEVEAALGGKLVRARVGPERAVLVNEGRRKRAPASPDTIRHESAHRPGVGGVG